MKISVRRFRTSPNLFKFNERLSVHDGDGRLVETIEVTNVGRGKDYDKVTLRTTELVAG